MPQGGPSAPLESQLIGTEFFVECQNSTLQMFMPSMGKESSGDDVARTPQPRPIICRVLFVADKGVRLPL